MEGIQVSISNAGVNNQVSVIKVGGYIDTTTSAEVERALNSLLKQGRYQIIIDLKNVDYISSAGWGIFISEIKAIRENNGDLKLVEMMPDVYEIFELLEFHHILDVYDHVGDAVNRFQESQFVEVVSAAPKAPVVEPIKAAPVPKPSKPVFEKSQSKTVQENFESAQSTPEVTKIASASSKSTIIDRTKMTVEDKIKDIIIQNPTFGAYKINRLLNSAEYGFIKEGWFKVRSHLSRLGLKSRKNRAEFARNNR